MTHHVEVNECRALATRRGADWWATFRHHYEPLGRIRVLKASIGGDLVTVACDDRGHAVELAAHMVTQGLPASAVRVRADNSRKL